MSAAGAEGSLASCQPVYECLGGSYRNKFLYISVDLGIYDALAGGVTMTAEQLADKLHLKADRLERFLRTLIFLELIEKHENGFRNSPASEMYLVSSSPRSVLGLLRLQAHTDKTFFEVMTDTLKGHGRLDKPQTQDSKEFHYDNLYDQTFEAKVFGEGMQALGRSDMDCMKYVDFTGIKTVVDLGGSLGWQAQEIRRYHPSVENVIVADLERVTQIGSQIPENKEARIEYRTVDFLTDELPQADAYILGHMIHCYPDKEDKDLLRKVHKALRPGGLLIVLETVLQANKTAPWWTVILDMIMLVNFAGCERTADEYKALLASEGFTDFNCQLVKGSPMFDVVTARKA